MTTITLPRAVVEQALDALETIPAGGADLNQLALTVAGVTLALRAALAAPPPQPVAWRFQSSVGGWAYGSQPPLGSKYPVHPLYAAPPAAPSVPVEIATSADAKSDALEKAGEAYSNAPPQRPPVKKLLPRKLPEDNDD